MMSNAHAKMKAAQASLAEARQALQSFVSKHCRTVAGGLVYVAGLNTNRDWLDEKLRELTVAYDQALTKFHAATAEWAKWKKGSGAA